MTANEKRKKVVDQYKIIIGRNIYSQDLVKRECVYAPHTDKKYYSDCSSSVRWAYKRANIGLDYIGGNTVGMYTSKLGKQVDVTIKNGVITDVSKLRVGDILLFAGYDEGRSAYGYCGHVEMVYSINGNTITICGHGSGNPSYKNLNTYCKSRFNKKTSTKLGHTGLIKVVRFIEDDPVVEPKKEETKVVATTKKKNPYIKPSRVLKKGMTGLDVRWLQFELLEAGITRVKVGLVYKTLEIDGEFGDITEAATKEFQKSAKLVVDGKAGTQTVTALAAK